MGDATLCAEPLLRCMDRPPAFAGAVPELRRGGDDLNSDVQRHTCAGRYPYTKWAEVFRPVGDVYGGLHPPPQLVFPPYFARPLIF